MNLLRALSLLSILPALAMGGCKTRPPTLPTIDAEFALETAMLDGRMVFIGVGGEIDGKVNPDLPANAGEMIRVVLVNGDGMPHDFAIPGLNAQTALVSTKAHTTDVVFHASIAGEFVYYCTVAGHRQMGMEGRLLVRGQ
jgi:nitrite reductase (NO-forming)